MKKIYTLSIVIAMFIFYGCSSNNFNASDLEQSTIIVNYNNVNATTKESVIQSVKDDIGIVLENKTEYQYSYGEAFVLEVKLDNNWYKVPFDKNPQFLEIAINLKAHSKNEEVVELDKYFNNLPDGRYRIVKSLYHNGEEIVVMAPFEIKNSR